MTTPNDPFDGTTLHCGTIIRVEPFPEARIPAYKLWINLGEELGVRRSSARITRLYTPEELLHRQVLCVTSVSPRQIGPFVSEVLVTGFQLNNDDVVLVHPERPVPDGTRLA